MLLRSLLIAALFAQLNAGKLHENHKGFLPNEVDKDEITRRGEWVEYTGIVRSDVEQQQSIEAAFQTPPDDSDKWYISVITTDGCKYCQKLKFDFEHDATLQAWVNVAEPIKSWSHYQVYQFEDETQKERFKKIRIKGFPTLLIQPPINGAFGSSATVVWQKTGYDGNSEKLSQEMSNAIKRYVAAVNDDRRKNPNEFNREAKASDVILEPDESKKLSATPETEKLRSSGAIPVSDTIGVDPPFSVPNRDEGGSNTIIPREVTGVLTKRELKEILPQADEEFINTQYMLGVTKDEALRNWAARKETFGTRNIVHYIVVAVIALVIIGFFFLLLAILFVVGRFVYVRTIPDKPLKTEVVHEREVVHDHHSATNPDPNLVTLSKEEYANLVKSQPSKTPSTASQDIIL